MERARVRTVHAQAVAVLVFGGALAAVTMSACGSRGPLDDEPYADASPDVVTPDVEVEAATDGKPDVIDAGREGGSFIDCGICLFDQCSPAILECVQSPGCQAVFQCVIGTCITSGKGFSPQCLFSCGQSDLAGALQALQVFQCITGKCGPDCTQVLGLLGSLGGGGSSSGGSSTSSSSSGGTKDAGKDASSDGGKKNAAFKQTFSRWPALVSTLEDD
jgi:hypothetical protein